MDKFEKQIAMLKPEYDSARLKERLFMKKIMKARRTRQIRRVLLGALIVGILVVLAGALRRDLLDVIALTFRYFTDLPSLLTEYTNAYISAISWPSLAATALLTGVAGVLLKTRKDLLGKNSARVYRYATVMGVLALGFALVGLFGGASHASAQQEQLRRKLNERGHLEVRVNGNDYELYAKSGASDDSIRNQALIEQIRNFDISKTYPNLKDMSRGGFVAEVRAVNTKDNCIFYVERRLEPALNEVLDASASCIRAGEFPIYYLNHSFQPVKEPKWKAGQTMYISYAKEKSPQVDPGNPFAGHVGIVFLLPGKADDYVAQQLGEKLVPKDQPGTGVRECGIGFKETCPNTGAVDIFANGQGVKPSGDIGSAATSDSLRPRPGSDINEVFGKITAMDDTRLQLQTPSGRKVVIYWPRNVIQEFNKGGGAYYQTATGTLAVQVGDSLLVRFYYVGGMDLEKLQLSDVSFMQVAIKTHMPDPLKNETYHKDKSIIEKY